MSLSLDITKTIENKHGICLIHGNDIFITKDYKEKLYTKLKNIGYTVSKRYQINTTCNWNEILGACSNLELFAQQQIIELQLLKDLSKSASSLLQQCTELKNNSVYLIIDACNLNKITSQKWFKQVRERAYIAHGKDIAFNALPAWINQKFRQAGLTVEARCLKILAQNYNGNLIAFGNLLEQLKLIYPKQSLSLDQIEPFIENSGKYTVFDLINSIENFNPEEAIDIINNLKISGIEPSLVLWCLCKQLRMFIAIKEKASAEVTQEYNLWPQRYNKLKSKLDITSVRDYEILLSRLHVIDKEIKQNSDALVWEELLQICTGLSDCRRENICLN